MKNWLFLVALGSAQVVFCQQEILLAHNDLTLSDKGLTLAWQPNRQAIDHLDGEPVKPLMRRSVGCDQQLFLSEDPIAPDTYEASDLIVATGVVQSGFVKMRAGNEVLLDEQSGNSFEVKLGATLEIEMGPCTF